MVSDIKNDEERIILSQNVMRILDDWKLDGEHILSILALPKEIKVRHLSQFRKSRAFPDTPKVNERIRHLEGIMQALSTSYPTNPRMSLFWMTKTSKRFKNRTPVQVLVEDDLDGLISIRKHLDCSYDWFGDTN